MVTSPSVCRGQEGRIDTKAPFSRDTQRAQFRHQRRGGQPQPLCDTTLTKYLPRVGRDRLTKGADKSDERDREINRSGEYIGQSLVAIGGVAALGMSMAELSHFCIANSIYLAFMLSALLGSAVKVVAYRRGLQSW